MFKVGRGIPSGLPNPGDTEWAICKRGGIFLFREMRIRDETPIENKKFIKTKLLFWKTEYFLISIHQR